MPRRPPSDERLLAKVVRIGQLLDAYGSLLTDKQRSFMLLHYEEDLSFGEIAKDFNVSRQAIHDAVKHAERSLEEYEERLGLLKRRRGAEQGAADGANSQLAHLIEGTLRRIRSTGVIYNSDWLVNDLRRALDLLQSDGAPEAMDAAQDEEETA